ncbi:MAG: hypothetical protein WB986_04635, partial [Methanoregula sp.]|uniref:hypothetical protein n=1 Tax=Methanoregula sp. TaxID=2052170 RepID=UPI003C46B426
PVRPAAKFSKFSKTFVRAAALLKKSPVTLPEDFQKWRDAISDVQKKVRGDCRTFGKKSGREPGIPEKILPLPGVLVRLAPSPPDQGCAHPGPY